MSSIDETSMPRTDDAPGRSEFGEFVETVVPRSFIGLGITTYVYTPSEERLFAARLADGVDVSRVANSTTTFGDTLLMPVSEPSAWTYAVAELASIGGFDTWTPALIDGDLPRDDDAVLVVGEPD